MPRAVKFLKDLSLKDPMMFVVHTTDDEGRLQHIFWCDGESRMNYEFFGDMMAFVATCVRTSTSALSLYFLVLITITRQQYLQLPLPLCQMRRRRHMFGCWKKILEAMNGKAPSSVITDGDLAMKNAIHRVFPQSHHRLCAWHLLGNATSNVGIPDFMPWLKRCMLGDYDVLKFEEIWNEMVAKFGLEDNARIRDLYTRKTKCGQLLVLAGIFLRA